MALVAASKAAAAARRRRRMSARSSGRRQLDTEYTFGPGPLGIKFTTAASGMPIRIDMVVPGSQAEQMNGLQTEDALCKVNGVEIGERTHAEVIAMIKTAVGAAAAAHPAGSDPVRLSFLNEPAVVVQAAKAVTREIVAASDAAEEIEGAKAPAPQSSERRAEAIAAKTDGLLATPAPEPESTQTVPKSSPASTEQVLDAQAPEQQFAVGMAASRDVGRQTGGDESLNWVAMLAGEWEATGQLDDQPGEVEFEWLVLKVSPAGKLSGLVDDGDGVLDSNDCRIEHDQCVVHPDGTYHVAFNQVYSDGAVTHWKSTYSPESDMLVVGRWEGDVSGTFQARRRQPEPQGTNLSSKADAANAAVAKAIAAGTERTLKLQQRGVQNEVATPVRRMSPSSGEHEATSPFAAARDELESLTRGAASLFSEAERDLEQSAAQVAELEAMLEQKDAEVQNLKQALMERDATIQEKDEQLEQKEKRLVQLSSALRALTHDSLS